MLRLGRIDHDELRENFHDFVSVDGIVAGLEWSSNSIPSLASKSGDCGITPGCQAPDCSLFTRKSLTCRGFRNGEIPPSAIGAFHKPASSRSQRTTRQWMAIFADNSQGSLLCCPLSLISSLAAILNARPLEVTRFSTSHQTRATSATGREEGAPLATC